MTDHQGSRRRNPVTAVIPAYDEEQYIDQLLDVLSQVSVLLNIIVVDDASTDDTLIIVLKHSFLDERVQLVCLPTNQGKGALW